MGSSPERLPLVAMRLAAPIVMLLIALGTPARAADDASAWDGDARSAARLIAGTRPTDRNAPLRAGIEIRLASGWHTYWRYPGDAGVPPRFDFAGSQNLRSAEVLWPAPKRLSEAGLETIGYDHGVILPLRVTPQDAGKPVQLRLKLEYAVCEKICIPAEAKGELALAGGSAAQDVALAAAETRVPRKVALGEGQGIVVRAVRREDGAARPRILVDVAAPAGAAVELFAEGPTPEWSLPVPLMVDGAPAGLKRFAFELDGAPPDTKYDGALLNLTAVTDAAAIEVPFRLD